MAKKTVQQATVEEALSKYGIDIVEYRIGLLTETDKDGNFKLSAQEREAMAKDIWTYVVPKIRSTDGQIDPEVVIKPTYYTKFEHPDKPAGISNKTTLEMVDEPTSAASVSEKIKKDMEKEAFTPTKLAIDDEITEE